MKNIVKLMLVGVAFVATPAMACNLAGSKEPATPATFGITTETNPVAIANALVAHPSYKTVMATCSVQQVVKSLATLNGWNDPEAKIAPDFRFQIPLLVAPSAQPVTAPASQVSASASTPVVQAIPSATPADSKPVSTVVAGKDYGPDLARLNSQLAENSAQLNQLKGRPLTSGETAWKEELESTKAIILAEIADIKRQLALKADITYVDQQDALLREAIAGKANSADVYTKAEIDSKLANFSIMPSWPSWATVSAPDWLSWPIAVGGALLFALLFGWRGLLSAIGRGLGKFRTPNPSRRNEREEGPRIFKVGEALPGEGRLRKVG